MWKSLEQPIARELSRRTFVEKIVAAVAPLPGNPTSRKSVCVEKVLEADDKAGEMLLTSFSWLDTNFLEKMVHFMNNLKFVSTTMCLPCVVFENV